MFERRLYYHIDWALVAAMFALCGIGVVMIYSTTSDPTRGTSHLWVTQLYAIGLGIVAMLVTLSLDYRTFTDKSHFIYIALLVVLVYVLFFGMVQMGARRWIPLKALQPSAFGVRQDRRRPRAGQVLRGEPRSAADERSRHRRARSRCFLSRSSTRSRTSARR